jgi:DNA polymerase III subunit epsilon
MYAIVDVETTGGSPAFHRVIEIAVVLHDGVSETGRYSTLINPGCPIPAFITALTGIRAEELTGAPVFGDVAAELADLLGGRVFVAHNVNFDYGFLKREFEACNLAFQPRKLCSVRLSRRIFPGLSSYSLGNICAHLGIENPHRHRALGDALATSELFSRLVQASPATIQESLKRSSRESTLPPNLPRETFERVPAEPGVYFFHDRKGRVIYVGKAVNMRSRVSGHFSGSSSREKRLFMESVHDLSWELLGDELIALLEESHQIKKLRPEYNRAQIQADRNYALYAYQDQAGYERLSLGKARKGEIPRVTFRSFQEGRSALHRLCREFGLCPKLCGLQSGPAACWDYKLGACRGACIGREAPSPYNERLNEALATLRVEKRDLVILCQGRNSREQAFVLIEQGGYLGYGFADKEEALSRPDDFRDRLCRRDDNSDVQRILSSFLQNPGYRKILEFDMASLRVGT